MTKSKYKVYLASLEFESEFLCPLWTSRRCCSPIRPRFVRRAGWNVSIHKNALARDICRSVAVKKWHLHTGPFCRQRGWFIAHITTESRFKTMRNLFGRRAWLEYHTSFSLRRSTRTSHHFHPKSAKGRRPQTFASPETLPFIHTLDAALSNPPKTKRNTGSTKE